MIRSEIEICNYRVDRSVVVLVMYDWLDVVPQGQAGRRFAYGREGYNSALDGIYYKLTSETLYGWSYRPG
ncbi:MAG: hypothetical protein ACLUPL_08130 [Butyricimonas virosa]